MVLSHKQELYNNFIDPSYPIDPTLSEEKLSLRLPCVSKISKERKAKLIKIIFKRPGISLPEICCEINRWKEPAIRRSLRELELSNYIYGETRGQNATTKEYYLKYLEKLRGFEGFSPLEAHVIKSIISGNSYIKTISNFLDQNKVIYSVGRLYHVIANLVEKGIINNEIDEQDSRKRVYSLTYFGEWVTSGYY